MTRRRAKTIIFGQDRIWITMTDDSSWGLFLDEFPRLLHATPEQRANWRLIGNGEGVHWPEIDEDLSIAAFLQKFYDDPNFQGEKV